MADPGVCKRRKLNDGEPPIVFKDTADEEQLTATANTDDDVEEGSRAIASTDNSRLMGLPIELIAMIVMDIYESCGINEAARFMPICRRALEAVRYARLRMHQLTICSHTCMYKVYAIARMQPNMISRLQLKDISSYGPCDNCKHAVNWGDVKAEYTQLEHYVRSVRSFIAVAVSLKLTIDDRARYSVTMSSVIAPDLDISRLRHVEINGVAHPPCFSGFTEFPDVNLRFLTGTRNLESVSLSTITPQFRDSNDENETVERISTPVLRFGRIGWNLTRYGGVWNHPDEPIPTTVSRFSPMCLMECFDISGIKTIGIDATALSCKDNYPVGIVGSLKLIPHLETVELILSRMADPGSDMYGRPPRISTKFVTDIVETCTTLKRLDIVDLQLVHAYIANGGPGDDVLAHIMSRSFEMKVRSCVKFGFGIRIGVRQLSINLIRDIDTAVDPVVLWELELTSSELESTNLHTLYSCVEFARELKGRRYSRGEVKTSYKVPPYLSKSIASFFGTAYH